jgi:cytochrome oxidase assembly protein ShyY1
MIHRPDHRRPYNSRVDNLISWFAVSVMVTAGVIYVLKLQEDRSKPKPERVLARATPAQEPRRRGRRRT